MPFFKRGDLTASPRVGLPKKSFPSYLLLCFLIPAVLMYLLYLLMKIPPIGDGTFLVLDMNGQYIYFFEAFREAITGDSSLIYSFSRTLGGEFLGIYAYYLASPLSYITLLFPAERILEAVFTVILLKTGLCGLTFGFYLHKSRGCRAKSVSVMFSVLYALSAYGVVYQSNTMWIDALIWLPLLTLRLEKLFYEGAPGLYMLSLAMTVLSNYYIGYMVCIYALLYFVYLCIRERIDPKGRAFVLLKRLASFALFSLVSVAICGAFLAAAYHSLTLGKYGFSQPQISELIKISPIELISKLLPGAYDTVRPQGLPFIYCGVITLILVPLYFLRKDIPKRERLASLLLVLVFFLSFCIAPIDILWHGGQEPHWLNYRYSFILSFLLLVLAHKALGGIEQIKEKTPAALLIITAILSCLSLDTYITSDSGLLMGETVILTALSAALIFTLLSLIIKFARESRQRALCISSIALTLLVCGEAFINGAVLMRQLDRDVCYSTHSGYTQYIGNLRPVADEISSHDSAFYRAEKLSHRKFNDNMALGLYGLSGSTSTLHGGSVRLLGELGYVGESHYTQYKGGDPVADSLLGVKYLIGDSEDSKPSELHRLLFVKNGYPVWENPYALSVAFGTDPALLSLELDRYGNPFDRLNAIASAAVGAHETVDIFEPVEDYELYGSSAIVSYEEGARVYSPNYSASGAYVNYEFTATRDGDYYFYPKLKYQTETNLRINGGYYGDYLDAKNDSKVYLGSYTAGERVKVSLEIKEPIYIFEGETPIWYFDSDDFGSVFDQLLASPQLVAKEGEGNTLLLGSVTTLSDSSTLLLTLPYDKGLRVYIDGEEAETSPILGALTSFEIHGQGEHSIEIKYLPRIYLVGGSISLLGITTLAFLLLRKRKRGYFLWK